MVYTDKTKTNEFIVKNKVKLGEYMCLADASNVKDTELFLHGYVKFLGVTNESTLIVEFVELNFNTSHNDGMQITCLDSKYTILNWQAQQ